jgi:glycosyltransferase involved in cell wall biosynthesis
LLIASECNPEWPSLPVVGYKACRAIAGVAQAVVATHIRNREAIERAGFGAAGVEYIDNEYIARPVYRLGKLLRGGDKVAWTINTALDYPTAIAFEWEVWRRFREDLRAGRFDVVHRITPMSPTTPSLMAGRSPVPFVLGPLNGGLKWPREFGAELRREREWMAYFRAAHKVLPGYRRTYRRAAAVLAAFEHTAGDIPPACRERVIDFPEVGFDPNVFFPPAHRTSRDRVTILYAGRLVPYKCPDIVVAAFAGSQKLRRHRLVVAGDGPERPSLETMVSERGLAGCVEFVGSRTQAQVADLMREADIFAFPSIRELGAGVVVEAMACGLACIVADYGGPAGLIASDRGFKVPLTEKTRMVESVRAALESLVEDPGRRASMGAAASRHATEFYTWEAKAVRTLEVYRWVLGRRQSKPRFDESVPEGVSA